MVATIALSLPVTSVAGAQQGGAAESTAAQSEDSTRRAAQLFETALKQVRERRYEEAATLFEEAYRLKPHYAVLYNLAQAYAAADEHQRALETFKEYLRLGGTAIPPERRSQVEDTIAALERESGAKPPCESLRSPTDAAAVSFVSNADDFVVVVNSKPTSSPVQLSVGSHELEARAEGYLPHRLLVSIPNACPQTIRLTLQPASASGPQQSPKPLMAGSEGIQDRPVESVAASSSNTLAWALAGSSVVLLGSGIGVYVWNDGRFSDWETEHEDLRQADSMGGDSATIESRKQANNALLDKIETMDVVSLALIGTGVVAGGVSTYLFLDDSPTAEQPTRVGFLADGHGAWVQVRTCW